MQLAIQLSTIRKVLHPVTQSHNDTAQARFGGYAAFKTLHHWEVTGCAYGVVETMLQVLVFLLPFSLSIISSVEFHLVETS